MQEKMEIQQQTIRPVSFDDLPVGRKSNNHMFVSEHPQNFVDQPIVQQKQSLQKRLQSKLWKTRQQAYEQLAVLFAQDQSAFSTYEQHLLKYLTDSNINCQERGFKILQIYATKNTKINIDLKNLMKILLEKGITSAKPEILRHSNNIIAELFSKGFKQEIYAAIQENLSHKNHKIVCCCMELIIYLLNQFGLKKLDMLKRFFKEIQKHVDSSTSSIKQSFIYFYREVYKWMGDGLTAMTGKLKKNQLQEIDKFAKTYIKVPMIPLRLDQKQFMQEQMKQLIDIDPYEIADPVDILSKYDEAWTEKVLATEKWVERKEMLDAAIKQWQTPKILPRDYYHVTAFLKRVLADSNITIQICGIKMLACLAKALRKHFSQGAKIFSSLLIQKLRDKKHQIVEETQKALKYFFHAISLEELVEYIKQGLSDKAPNMRVQLLKFLQQNITKKDQRSIKALLDLLFKLVSDSSLEVRDKVFEVLNKIKGFYGISFFGDRIKQVNSQKLTKLLHQKTESDVSELSASIVQSKKMQASNKMVVEEVKPVQRMAEKNELNIGHPNQTIRQSNYQTILANKINLSTFTYIKTKGIKESSPTILKLILQIISKIFGVSQIQKEVLEYILWHDWKKAKILLVEFFQKATIASDCNQLVRSNPLLRQILSKQIKQKPITPQPLPLKQKIQIHAKPQKDRPIQQQVQKVIKESYNRIETYAPKWNNTKPVDQNIKLLPKLQRLKLEPTNPWPLTPSSPHVQQLILLLNQMPPPFPQLASPLPINISYVRNLLQSNSLNEYSDIIVKWLFWRFQIQRRQTVLLLIELAKKLIACGLELMQITILLSGIVGAITLGPQVLDAVCQLNKQFEVLNYQEKVFLFWINFTREPSAPINEILYIIRQSFSDILHNQLVNLASIPAVKNNKEFIAYLKKTYDSKLLKVYGFQTDQRVPRSKSIKLEANSQPSTFQNIFYAFKTKPFADAMQKILTELSQKSLQEILNFHINLMQNMIVAFFSKQVQAQNFIEYLANLSQILTKLPVQKQILRVVKSLILLLMDLDEIKPENHAELIKIANTTMLKLLEVTPFQPIFSALTALLKQQINKMQYNKTIAILSKCLIRVVKYENFGKQIQSNYKFALQQILQLLDQHHTIHKRLDTQFYKNLKNTIFEISKLSPKQTNTINEMFYQQHKENQFFKDFLAPFIKKNQPISDNLEGFQKRINQIKAKCGFNDIEGISTILNKKPLE